MRWVRSRATISYRMLSAPWANFIFRLVQPNVNFKPFRCCCVGNRFYNDLMSLKWFALPVARDVAKQAVLDLVPFAGAGRIVTDFDNQSCFVRQALQFQFPQPIPGTIATATVGCDYQPLSRPVAFSSKLLPPTINRRNCELRCVRTDSD